MERNFEHCQQWQNRKLNPSLLSDFEFRNPSQLTDLKLESITIMDSRFESIIVDGFRISKSVIVDRFNTQICHCWWIQNKKLSTITVSKFESVIIDGFEICIPSMMTDLNLRFESIIVDGFRISKSVIVYGFNTWIRHCWRIQNKKLSTIKDSKFKSIIVDGFEICNPSTMTDPNLRYESIIVDGLQISKSVIVYRFNTQICHCWWIRNKNPWTMTFFCLFLFRYIAYYIREWD